MERYGIVFTEQLFFTVSDFRLGEVWTRKVLLPKEIVFVNNSSFPVSSEIFIFRFDFQCFFATVKVSFDLFSHFLVYIYILKES